MERTVMQFTNDRGKQLPESFAILALTGTREYCYDFFVRNDGKYVEFTVCNGVVASGLLDTDDLSAGSWLICKDGKVASVSSIGNGLFSVVRIFGAEPW
jgi:hypothetical protein